MHFDIKLKKIKKKKQTFGSYGTLYSSFLEILELKNPYKRASALSNAIMFFKNMKKQQNTKVNVHLGHY